MPVSPPSGVLSAYWNWQQECCSKCYLMLLPFTERILQHTQGSVSLTIVLSRQLLWPFLSAADTVPYICWPCIVVSATYTYGLICVDFCKCECANSGRSARRHTAWMLSFRGTKRKWQGNPHSVSIAMVAQARLFIPRLMGWRLELKVPDWKKHVPVLLKISK